MPKYNVIQTRTYTFYQQVEAESIQKAFQLAGEGEWEQDENDVEEETTAKLMEGASNGSNMCL